MAEPSPQLSPIQWPGEWSFKEYRRPQDLIPGDLVPVAVSMPPLGIPECGNCGDLGTVYARKISSRGPLFWLGGFRLHGGMVSAPCPVCQGAAKDTYLSRVSGLMGLVLDGKDALAVRLTDVLPLSGQEAAFEVAWLLLSELPLPRSWALFSGDYGRGKTHILAGLVNGCRLAGIRALYATADGLLNALKATFEEGASEQTSIVRRGFEAVPVLALDEVNRVHWTSWAGQELFGILNARHMAARATWFGSNLGPSALSEVSEELAALVSRMSAGYMTTITGPDRRPVLPPRHAETGAPTAPEVLPDRFLD